jgi:membrane protein
VWVDLRAAAPRPTLAATLKLLALLLCFLLLTGVASAARAHSFAAGLVLSIVVVVPYAALWLLVTARMPHRDADLRALLPGAVLFGFGVEVVHAVTVWVIGPMALEKQGTYGALGLGAALLLALFLVSRLIVVSAVVNATLWERRLRGQRTETAASNAG